MAVCGKPHFPTEQALRTMGFDPSALNIALVLPSNEAVLSAVLAGRCAGVMSRSAADPHVATGWLAVFPVSLPPRAFIAIRHKERHGG
nr:MULTISPECIES: LysR substrate-binding domain-containing protein [unclassified Mesorhizobium]